jgi:hypothetical protein
LSVPRIHFESGRMGNLLPMLLTFTHLFHEVDSVSRY